MPTDPVQRFAQWMQDPEADGSLAWCLDRTGHTPPTADLVAQKEAELTAAAARQGLQLVKADVGGTADYALVDASGQTVFGGEHFDPEPGCTTSLLIIDSFLAAGAGRPEPERYPEQH